LLLRLGIKVIAADADLLKGGDAELVDKYFGV
jgi:hypothetical protein